MIQFEQTFMNFLFHHQEKFNRTYHFLILMDAVISAAKHIQHYYLTGALKGNLGLAGEVNIQGEEVMRMDQIAHEIVIHYLKSSERVIHAVSEEEELIIPLEENRGRYFFYFDPLDGSANVSHGLPVGFLFGIAKKNLNGDEDGHLRAGNDYIAAGMFVIPTGTFTLALRDAGAWRFHVDETMNFVKPLRMILPDDPKSWELSFNEANRYTFAEKVQNWIGDNENKYSFRYLGALAGDFHRLLSNGGMVRLVDMLWMRKVHPSLTKNLNNPISELLSMSVQKSSLMILPESYRDKQLTSCSVKPTPCITLLSRKSTTGSVNPDGAVGIVTGCRKPSRNVQLDQFLRRHIHRYVAG
jgi:fructose-1,6-bisphosphatase I